MKLLKTLSVLGGVTSIGVGAILLIKGLKGQGVLWAGISGAIIISSGIMNIVAVRLGILDSLRSLLLRLLGLFEKKIE